MPGPPSSGSADGRLLRLSELGLRGEETDGLRREGAHRVLVARGRKIRVSGEDGQVRIAWLEDQAAQEVLRDGPDPVFLGLAEGVRHWAVEAEAPAADGDGPELDGEPGTRFADLRSVASVLAPLDGDAASRARALLHHHATHRRCGLCGGTTASRELGGHRACTDPACGHTWFPRSDPAVIAVLERRGRCLLARQGGWPEGLFATVAGFVEPGESLEQALAREVAEETGLEVVTCRYRFSQPWPYPSSLMVGFRAVVRGRVVLDAEELEEARWFTREELDRAVGGGEIRLPPPFSISCRLIEEWWRG